MFVDIKTFLETHATPSFDIFCLQDLNPVSRNRKTRKISNPNPSMREIHRRIIQVLREIHLFSWNVFDSPYQNARHHLDNRYFYQTDLRDAYGSVSLERMAGILVSLKPEWKLDNVREVLARYCFESSGMGLIVGAPASPALFNIYAQQTIDEPLAKFWPYMNNTCRIFFKCYSRYLDDLTFSSREPITSGIRQMIRRVVERAGFQVNHRKSTVLDIRKGPVIITGVGLEYCPNRSARLFLPRHFLSRMNGLLHLALRGDPRVGLSEVEGLMGVFYGVLRRKDRKQLLPPSVNATELKFLKKYQAFRSRYNMRH